MVSPVSGTTIMVKTKMRSSPDSIVVCSREKDYKHCAYGEWWISVELSEVCSESCLERPVVWGLKSGHALITEPAALSANKGSLCLERVPFLTCVCPTYSKMD